MDATTQTGWRGLPGIRNLRVGHKHFLVGFALLLPFFLTLAWMIRHTYLENIEATQKEVYGTHVVLDLQQVLCGLQTVRVTSVALASGDSRLANEVGAAEAKTLEAAVQTVDSQDASYQQALGTMTAWTPLGDLIRATLKASERMHAEESVTRYEEVTGKTYDFIVTVCDQASLSQDPDVDLTNCYQLSLACMDVVRRFGVAAELIASRGALRQNLNMDDTTELIRLMTLIDHDEDAAESAYRKVGSRNPGLRTQLEEGFNAFKAACDGFLDYIQNGVLANGGDLPRSVHGHMLGSVAGAAKFMTALAPAQVVLLHARQESDRRSIRVALATGAVATLVVCLIALVIGHDVTAPLQEVVRTSQALADGDFSVEVPPVERGDEFGGLNVALAAIVDNVQAIMAGLHVAVRTLPETTGQIMRLTRESATVHQIAATINDTVVNVEEVRQSVKLASQQIDQVTRSARQAEQLAQVTQQATEQTLQQIQRLLERSISMGDIVRRFREQAQTITDITEAVNRLAEDSNQVSYNVSVEASKAGVQGAGFAVVAQQVRRLAEQSQQATGQVRGIMAELQRSTATAINLNEDGTRAVQEGLRQSTEANSSARSLAARVSETAQAATQISNSTHLQVSGLDQAASAMTAIRAGNTDSAQTMQNLQAYGQKLYQLSQQLKALGDQYPMHE